MIEDCRPYDLKVAKNRLALLGINRPVNRDAFYGRIDDFSKVPSDVLRRLLLGIRRPEDLRVVYEEGTRLSSDRKHRGIGPVETGVIEEPPRPLLERPRDDTRLTNGGDDKGGKFVSSNGGHPEEVDGALVKKDGEWWINGTRLMFDPTSIIKPKWGEELVRSIRESIGGALKWIEKMGKDAGKIEVIKGPEGTYYLADDPQTAFYPGSLLFSANGGNGKYPVVDSAGDRGSNGHTGARFKVVRERDGGVRFAFEPEETEFRAIISFYMKDKGLDEKRAKQAALRACELVSVTEWRRGEWQRMIDWLGGNGERSEPVFVEEVGGVVWTDVDSPTTYFGATLGYRPMRERKSNDNQIPLPPVSNPVTEIMC